MNINRYMATIEDARKQISDSAKTFAEVQKDAAQYKFANFPDEDSPDVTEGGAAAFISQAVSDVEAVYRNRAKDERPLVVHTIHGRQKTEE